MKNAGDISKEEITNLIRKSRRVFFKSNFSFLCHHNGLRPSNIHVLMGTAGCGKSTFIRSVINDSLNVNPETALMWLSEESSEQVQVDMHKQGGKPDSLSKLLIYSELEYPEDSLEDVFKKIEMLGVKVIVLDNITTSKFYMDMKPDEQSKTVSRFKAFVEKNGIALVLVAHTKKDVHDNYGKMITEGDLRGSGALTMMAEFFYIMQKFEDNGKFYPTLRIMKHRGQEVTERIYALKYERETASYTQDVQIEFEKFKELFTNRDKL